jgi:hypothetical protein
MKVSILNWRLGTAYPTATKMPIYSVKVLPLARATASPLHMQVQYGTLRHAGHYGIIRRDGAPRESFYAVEAAMGLGGRTANKAEVAD